MREPEDAGWDADGFDGGDNRPDEDRGGSVRGPSWTTGSDPSSGEFRPGLEALRLAIDRPEDVGHRLEAVLFRDGLQRAAFQALVDASDLHEALDTSPPDVRALLVRLSVEEPTVEPDEVVLQLVRDASRRELQVITAEARRSASVSEEAIAAAGWVQELDDREAWVAATARLVAWLVVRAQTSTAGQGS